MKRFVAGGLCGVSLLVASSSHAQWESGATLITVNLGYAASQSGVTTETIHGASFNGDLEFAFPGKPITFGLAAASIVFDENGTVAGNPAEIRSSSSPVYGTIKAWLGHGRVRGYLGLGLGFHQSKLERSSVDGYRVDTTTGFAMEVPLGGVVHLGERVFLHGSLALHVLGQSFLDSNLAGVANYGVGFRLAAW